jgi:uncharacterized SAM-binding protein YcdF (DUF218 family)
MGEYLVEEHEPEPADAIVVLAGSFPDRIMEAVALYRDGFAPRIVLSRERESPATAELRAMGLHFPAGHEWNRMVAEKLGVPATALTEVGGTAGSTFSETRLLLDYLLGEGHGKILLVTSKLHSYRAALIFRHVAGDKLRIIVRPSRYDRFEADSWWRDRTDLRRVVIEYEKLLVFYLIDRWLSDGVMAALQPLPE